MPKYSIIIPFYNVADYIIECAESLHKQKYVDFEAIFVDDGSPDNSKKLLEEYIVKKKEKRFTILSKVNGGQGSARNLGLKKAKGEYILFLDSDDFIADNCLSEVDKVLSKEKLDVLFFDFYNYFDPNHYSVAPSMYTFTDDIKKMAIISPPAPWSKIYNKEFLLKTKVEFLEKLWYEDLGTTPKVLANASKIKYLKKPLHYYRQREGSVMNSINPKMFDMYNILDSIYDYYRENNLLDMYHDELERIFLYNSFFIVQKLAFSDYKNKWQEQIKMIDYLEKHYPNWVNNKYFKLEKDITQRHMKIMKHKHLLKFYNIIRKIF